MVIIGDSKMAKLSICSEFSFPLPMNERLKKIKAAGFEATSFEWEGDDKDSVPDLARKLGLDIDYIHAPFDPLKNNPNFLWTDYQAGDEYLDMLVSCINDCKLHKIPTVVIHITWFEDSPGITELGIDRVKRLVDYAEKQEVNLAFENLNYLEQLDYIFQHINSNRLGFCYDNGHENWRHPKADCLSRYGHRLFTVHLNDNFGDNDQHLLPYDGTIDWKKTKRKLVCCKKLEYLTLEVVFDAYRKMSVDEFLVQAYQRALRLLNE